jgi:hypothetical protein
MIVSKWDMLHHGERINQEMTLSAGYLKLRTQLTPLKPCYYFFISQQQRQFLLNLIPNSTNNIRLSASLFAISILVIIIIYTSSFFIAHFSTCNNSQTIPVRGI